MSPFGALLGVPNVYCYFDPDHSTAALLRVWATSWRKRGWSPRILTVRNAQEHPDFASAHWQDYPRLAIEKARRGKSVLVDIEAINFSLRPWKFFPPKDSAPVIYLSDGWENARVVLFSNVHDPEIIAHCGRPL